MSDTETKPTMTTLDAIMLIEDADDDTDQEQYYAAWQLLHDTGLAYQLQGWYGRAARRMISHGFITE